MNSDIGIIAAVSIQHISNNDKSMLICQTIATAKRIVTDTGYAVGYGYVRQASAARKRFLANAGYTVGNGNAC